MAESWHAKDGYVWDRALNIVGSASPRLDVAEANRVAQLFAAAPLLLEACKRVASWPGIDPELREECIIAIQEAEGVEEEEADNAQ